MRKQTPREPRVHTGVNVDPGWQVLPLAPKSFCFLPHSTTSSTARCEFLFHASESYSSLANPRVTIYWNHWGYLSRCAEWRMTGTARDCDNPESTVLPEMHGPGPHCRSKGPIRWQPAVCQEKPEISLFIWNFSGRQALENLHAGGLLPAACQIVTST